MGRCKHYRSPSHKYRSTRRLIGHLLKIMKMIKSHPHQEPSHPPSLFISDMREESKGSGSGIEHNNDTIHSFEHVTFQTTKHSFYTSTPKSSRNTCAGCQRRLFMEGVNYRPPDKPHSGLQQAVL